MNLVVEGIEDIIKRDLVNHKSLLERTKLELLSFRQARSHEIKKKKHYVSLIGDGKYDDDSLRKSIKDMNVNIRHMSDKADLAEKKIQHHTLIVDTLTENLKKQNEGLKRLAENRKKELIKKAIYESNN